MQKKGLFLSSQNQKPLIPAHCVMNSGIHTKENSLPGMGMESRQLGLLRLQTSGLSGIHLSSSSPYPVSHQILSILPPYCPLVYCLFSTDIPLVTPLTIHTSQLGSPPLLSSSHSFFTPATRSLSHSALIMALTCSETLKGSPSLTTYNPGLSA